MEEAVSLQKCDEISLGTLYLDARPKYSDRAYGRLPGHRAPAFEGANSLFQHTSIFVMTTVRIVNPFVRLSP